MEIPEDTLYTWIAKAKKGTLRTESKPKPADELDRLREENRALKQENKPYKYTKLLENMKEILEEDVYNFTYGHLEKLLVAE